MEVKTYLGKDTGGTCTLAWYKKARNKYNKTRREYVKYERSNVENTLHYIKSPSRRNYQSRIKQLDTTYMRKILTQVRAYRRS